jgi:endoglucanase
MAAVLLVVAVGSRGNDMRESDVRADPSPTTDWALYEAYIQHFVTSEGRVVDITAGGRSTSEGQAYALFFALVANDRPTFDKLLEWSDQNLADGQLGAKLPAWNWGKRDDGDWGVLDPNAASDADLWMAYALVEAGRLWDEPSYQELGTTLLTRVHQEEVVELPKLGWMLLPGPQGFHLAETRWRLNPSYLPLQLLERAHQLDGEGHWRGVKDNTVRLVRATTPHRMSADWVVYEVGKGFSVDPVSGDLGSYDAIRTYLWAAMLDDEEPAKGVLGTRLSAFGKHWKKHGRVPRSVKPFRGSISSDRGSVGFLGALLPEVDTWSNSELSARIREQIQFERNGELYGGAPDYYDHNLLLFGLGYAEHRFRFERDGRLTVPWGPR